MKMAKTEKDFIKRMIGTYGVERLENYIKAYNPSSENNVCDLIIKIIWDFINKIEKQNKQVISQYLTNIGWKK